MSPTERCEAAIAAAERLRNAGAEDDLRLIFLAALAHVGNEADSAHGFLSDCGLDVANAPGCRRMLVLNRFIPLTFGRTGEGEQCDESDLEP